MSLFGPPDPTLKKIKKVELELKRLELLKAERDLAAVKAGMSHRRILTLNGNVNESSVGALAKDLGILTSRSLDPVEIRMMSPGGAVLAGFALYDAMLATRREGVHLTTLGVGYTASMAGVLIQGGDTRVIARNAYFHIHEVSAGSSGNVSEMKDAAKFAETLWIHLSDILAHRSNWSAEDLRDRVERKDWWMGAEEALAEGFVDEVR
jgi:ATP-dependent Clp endopeptidase proteolytic subunit ClpP